MFVYKLQGTMKQVIDGTSKTFEVGEVVSSDENDMENIWSTAVRVTDSMRTTQSSLNAPPALWFHSTAYPGTILSGGFGSYHPGGGNFLYVDGHVSFISDSVTQAAYDAAATFRGGSDAIYPDTADPVQ